jgi:hypothetical protein
MTPGAKELMSAVPARLHESGASDDYNGKSSRYS